MGKRKGEDKVVEVERRRGGDDTLRRKKSGVEDGSRELLRESEYRVDECIPLRDDCDGQYLFWPRLSQESCFALGWATNSFIGVLHLW